MHFMEHVNIVEELQSNLMTNNLNLLLEAFQDLEFDEYNSIDNFTNLRKVCKYYMILIGIYSK